MRTSELTAVAALNGAIIAQGGPGLGQKIAWQTVRDRVRGTIGTTADDPDLPEVFEFLLSAGVTSNTYVDELLQWTAVFVDSKKRQLRYQAFAVLNRIDARVVWTKMSVVKRAYRKRPVHGFCPSPEPAWGEFRWTQLHHLEEMLRFFHVSCKSLVEAATWPAYDRIKCWGNVDCTAAEAFFNLCQDMKSNVKETRIQKALLDATAKYTEGLGLDALLAQKLAGKADWIDFAAHAAQKSPAETAVADSKHSAPLVIKFNESTGEQLNEQVNFYVAKVEKKHPQSCHGESGTRPTGRTCARTTPTKQPQSRSYTAFMQAFPWSSSLSKCTSTMGRCMSPPRANANLDA